MWGAHLAGWGWHDGPTWDPRGPPLQCQQISTVPFLALAQNVGFLRVCGDSWLEGQEFGGSDRIFGLPMVENGGLHTHTPWWALVSGEMGGRVFHVEVSSPGRSIWSPVLVGALFGGRFGVNLGQWTQGDPVISFNHLGQLGWLLWWLAQGGWVGPCVGGSPGVPVGWDGWMDTPTCPLGQQEPKGANGPLGGKWMAHKGFRDQGGVQTPKVF